MRKNNSYINSIKSNKQNKKILCKKFDSELNFKNNSNFYIGNNNIIVITPNSDISIGGGEVKNLRCAINSRLVYFSCILSGRTSDECERRQNDEYNRCNM